MGFCHRWNIASNTIVSLLCSNSVVLHVLSSLDQFVQEFEVLDLLLHLSTFIFPCQVFLLPQVHSLDNVVEKTERGRKGGTRVEELCLQQQK